MNVWSGCGVRHDLTRYLCASKMVHQIFDKMLTAQKIKIQRSKQNLWGLLPWESCPNGNRFLTDRMFYRPAEQMGALHDLRRIDFQRTQDFWRRGVTFVDSSIRVVGVGGAHVTDCVFLARNLAYDAKTYFNFKYNRKISRRRVAFWQNDQRHT